MRPNSNNFYFLVFFFFGTPPPQCCPVEMRDILLAVSGCKKSCTRTEVRIPPLIVPGTSVFRSSRRKHMQVPRISGNCIRDLAAAPRILFVLFLSGSAAPQMGRTDRQTDGGTEAAVPFPRRLVNTTSLSSGAEKKGNGPPVAPV